MTAATTEVWETATERHIRLRKTDSRGFESSFKIGGAKGRKFSITVEDRELNELLCFKPSQNPFRNGLLLPVKGGETAKVAEDPNLLNDEGVEALLLLEGNQFKSRLSKITSEATLRRIDMAAAELDPPLTKAKQEALNAALAPFEPILTVPSVSDLKDADMKEIPLSS